jgi:hypothetical protein
VTTLPFFLLYLLLPLAVEFIAEKLGTTQPLPWRILAPIHLFLIPFDWCLTHVPWVQKLLLAEFLVLDFFFGP